MPVTPIGKFNNALRSTSAISSYEHFPLKTKNLKSTSQSFSQNSAENINAYKNKYFNMPLESIRANFFPSFGMYYKVKDVPLIDRENGNTVKAKLLRDWDRNNDVLSYVLKVKNKDVGYMDIDCNAIFPESNEILLTEPDNNIPEICLLRSIDGDKYRGIGSAFIKAAIDLSKEMGKNGCVWLYSQKGYASNLSSYKKNVNPLPFYYKAGFKSPIEDLDTKISRLIEMEDYKHLPDTCLLLLSPKDAAKFLRTYSIKYKFLDF